MFPSCCSGLSTSTRPSWQEQLSSNIVLLQVKICTHVKQRKNNLSTDKNKMIRSEDREGSCKINKACACLCQGCIFGWQCENMNTLFVGPAIFYHDIIISQEVSRRPGSVLFGGLSDAGQDMRRQRCGSSSSIMPGFTLYHPENKNKQPAILKTDRPPVFISSRVIVYTETKRTRAGAMACCPGEVTNPLLECTVCERSSNNTHMPERRTNAGGLV